MTDREQEVESWRGRRRDWYIMDDSSSELCHNEGITQSQFHADDVTSCSDDADVKWRYE